MNNRMEVVLALVIVGATLAFGGVQVITYSLMEVVLFALALTLLWKQAQRGEIRLALPVWPILFVLLVVLQVVPLPTALAGRLSPGRLEDFKLAGATPSWTTLSVYPHATLVTLMRLLAYLCAFVLAASAFDFRKRRSTLLRVLILLGCFEAAYGIVQYVTGWQKIFTYTKKFDLEEATGTFINRNHFAGFLELVLPFVLAYAFYHFQAWSLRRYSGESGRSSGRGGPAQVLFFAFLTVFLVVAVIFSRSRMGILVTAFALMAVALLAQLRVGGRVWVLGILLFIGCVVGYGLWIGLGPVLARFELVGEPGYLRIEGRLSIWADVLRLIRQSPPLGFGLGTFEVVYRGYQTATVNFSVEHAHNDYLEFVSDTGIVGAVLLFLPIFYLLARMVISFLDDPRTYRRAVTLGCIGSTLAILLHSVTDFNLQIPANALVFAVVLGIGYKVACLDRHVDSDAGQEPIGR
ncbi:MAG: O-antigen ligase family protein [Acidobacteriia bacterium]|nr:O-antigen ligase family protein [Terriglobia bacterium]